MSGYFFVVFLGIVFGTIQPENLSTKQITNEVRLLSYGVHFRTWFVFNTSGNGDYRKERMALLFRHVVPQYDIMMLQEYHRTFRPFFPRKFEKTLSNFGFNHVAYGPTAEVGRFKWMDSGLITVSKYPIVERRIYTFNVSAAQDKLANKGVLYTKIQPNGQKNLHLFNTFLQTSYTEALNMNDPSVEARIKQIEEIRGFIEKVMESIPPNEIVILGGNLGIYAGDNGNWSRPKSFEEYDKMISIFNSGNLQFIDLAIAAGKGQSTFKPFPSIVKGNDTDYPSKGKEYRFDFLFQIKRLNDKVRKLPVELKPFYLQGEPVSQVSSNLFFYARSQWN